MTLTFENLGLSHQLLAAISHSGFTQPTQIQELSIPSIMQGKDLLGESATGSGKTLAFGCGIIEHVVPRNGLQALVLAPTRELAEQVKDSLKKFSYQKALKIITIYGGVSLNPQIQALEKADVVVATPGRLLDHLQRGTIDMSKVKMLVLDEVDRMFDMGFIDDVKRIISVCPAQRQTLFFSATISSRIKDLMREYMIEPVEVSAKTFVDPSKLKQVYYNAPKNVKLSLLVTLLQQEKSGLVMVFCNTRRTADFVVRNLKLNRINAISIHGGLSQNKRTKTISTFNDGHAGVLVCTDVVARGLHVDNVSHVYNYEIPNDCKDYVHRIGRTARAGEEGKVINLLSEQDHGNFSNVMREYPDFFIESTPLPPLQRVVVKKPERRDSPRGRSNAQGRSGFGGGFGNSGGFRKRSGPRRRSFGRRFN